MSGITEEKINLARKLNTQYHLFYQEREIHERQWKETLEICEREGISTDIIMVTPEIFNFLIKKNVAKQYFK